MTPSSQSERARSIVQRKRAVRGPEPVLTTAVSDQPPSDQSTRALDMRPFPMQDGPPIPWFLAEAIYTHLYRQRDQTLDRLAERGGFAWREVSFLWENPRWSTTPEQRAACARQVRVALDQEQR